MLARFVYGDENPTAAQVTSIDRAARRLIARGVATSAIANNGLKVYLRAEETPTPTATATPANDARPPGIPIARQWEENRPSPAYDAAPHPDHT